MSQEEVQVGTGDLRYDDTPGCGFIHVTLRDVDDGDCVVINEDDVVALRDLLNKTIVKYKLE